MVRLVKLAMKLSIIILNYHSAGLVRQCVRGVYKAPPPLEFEVIVVDNASSDGVGEWLKVNYPPVVFVQLKKNRGYSAGNNAGIKQAQGEYVLILNPDVVIAKGQLEQMVKFMNKNKSVGLAGPRLTNPDGSLQYSTYHWPSFWLPIWRRTRLGQWSVWARQVKKYQMMDWGHQDNRPVDWLLGACLIARQTALKTVGLLDERYFLYVEDTDWCRRFWQAGWQVYYIAEVSLTHFHERLSAQAGWSALFKKVTWIHISSWLKYFRKWGLKVPQYNN